MDQMQTRLVIIGAKATDIEVEGRRYNTTKIYTSTALDESSGTAIGRAGSEYTWGDSSNFKKIQSIKPPFEADVVLQFVSNGRNQKTVVIDVKPVVAKQG